MKRDSLQEREWAVSKYLSGDVPNVICTSLGHSRSWLYKWVSRYDTSDPFWNRDQSKMPKSNPHHTPMEVEEAVKMVRLSLYNRDLFCGAQAIHWELEDMGVRPLPSYRTINRILKRNSLTHRRTGRYLPKGTPYPYLSAKKPNEVQQSDFVGPLHLRGPLRFYSFNNIDVATSRCGVEPVFSRTSQSVINALWAVWWRLGMPKNIQVDNEMGFYGSPRYPRGMGALIRLCLHHGIEPWFIPVKEPWRNGIVEKFNHHYRQKFLRKIDMATPTELQEQSYNFEVRHNSTYRYSKLNGKTPIKVLAASGCTLIFPKRKVPPKHPLKKPAYGKYHLVRLIRSNLKLNVFGENYPMPSDLMYEYVVATVDVKEQKLKVFHDKTQMEEFDYKLR